MNDKNRVQVVIPEHLKDEFLTEVERSKHTESSLCVAALTYYLRPHIISVNKVPYNDDNFNEVVR